MRRLGVRLGGRGGTMTTGSSLNLRSVHRTDAAGSPLMPNWWWWWRRRAAAGGGGRDEEGATAGSHKYNETVYTCETSVLSYLPWQMSDESK